MKFKETVGIDVSKSTLDVCLHSLQVFTRVANTKKGYKTMLVWLKKISGFSADQVLFCFEHTGIYSFPLSCFLSEMQLNYTIVPGLEIKRSLGIQRGKNDKVDAKKIALYAYRRRDEITLYQMPDKSINEMRNLLSLREKLIKQRASLKVTMKEQSCLMVKKDNKLLFSVPQKLINELNKQIAIIDQEIEKVVEENQTILKNYLLVKSIPGVGRQTALHLIVITNNFVLFDDYRKLASYAGVAPFPYSSGTSIKGKNKVNPLANKKLKSLLSSCAVSAIRTDPEMKLYFKRRMEKGIHKMNTINAVRNKLLARVFAVVRRGTPFVTLGKFAA